MPEEQPAASVQVLEKGNIIFFYRPKKNIPHPKSPDDLERAYFMLLPDDQAHHQNRLFNVAHGVFPMIVPGKLLPEERDWAFVQDVGRDPGQVLENLEKEVPGPPPPTGGRIRPWARAAGEGRYVMVRHLDHTHLAYRLHKPTRPGEVQEELQIKPEASYIISVKNPYTPSLIELDKRPQFPERLGAKFDGQGWIPVDPTDYLDYPYTQVLLIGARTDVAAELGITIDAEAENQASREVLRELEKDAREAAKAGVSLLEPLTEGRWE